jgi:hypothetical protein
VRESAETPSSGEMAAAREWLAAARIAPEVAARFPGYAAILLTADGLVPGPSDPASDARLAAAEGRARGLLAGRAPEELSPGARFERRLISPSRAAPGRSAATGT